MTTFSTTHMGLASTIRYSLGANAHLATKRVEPKGTMTYIFHDEPPGSCASIAEKFFNRGAVIEDARLLMECSRKVRKTLTLAIANGGIWEKQ